MKELIDLIKNEDKKNPLTDDEIAKKLNLNRSEVVKLRQSLNIGNSRHRREEILESEMRNILKEVPDISERALTEKLKEKGFDVSRNIVSKFIKKIGTEYIHPEEEKQKVTRKPDDVFDTLIGSKGSLKSKIKLAQAAILYPPNGLHTLIYGATGVGKSDLAEYMHKFAISSGVKDKNSPFVVFNCADYAENPQLLLAQLFGYTKGAYTGAESDKAGLVEKANNGILFLDEIHRLPPEGQEILFYLIDKGKFRRLGETNIDREVKVMIIAATTEDIESSLLSTFRRRIPMLIELPSLQKRPLKERFEIIRSFFRQEASRINTKIVVSYNVVTALLLYEASGNLGQLRSDIQVACARGFLNCMVKKDKFIKIEIGDLPSQVAKGLLKINHERANIEKLLNSDLEVNPEDENNVIIHKENQYSFPKEIYKDIEEKYQKLENDGIDKQIINRVIGDELETKIQQLIKQVQFNKHNLIKNDLEKIVGEKIVYAVDNMMKKARAEMGDIDESLFYCLATHLSVSYERIVQNKVIINPQLDKIKREYETEYKVAEEMAKIGGFCLNIDFPEAEIGFIAMYLKSYSKKNMLNETRVGILVLTHGHVAEGMVAVANRLLGVDHARAVEMSLDESPEVALEKAIEVVKSIDKGKGVLILVDMGSLVSFGNIITDKIGVQTMTVTRVDTPMVIEATRKALLSDSDLREIAISLQNDKGGFGFEVNDNKKSKNLPKTVVSLCLTGEGTAQVVAELIKKYIPEIRNKVDVTTLAALNEDNITDVISEMSAKKDIVAIVGTVDPHIHGIRFISAKELIKGDGIIRLKSLIELKEDISQNYENDVVKEPLEELIKPELIIAKSTLNNKKDIIEKMASLLNSEGYVNEKFIISVHQRELLSPTNFKNMIALPHGIPEDVIKPAVAVMTLQEPVDWGEGEMVECVFMIALNYYSKQEFKNLYEIINNENIIKQIKKYKNSQKIREVIVHVK